MSDENYQEYEEEYSDDASSPGLRQADQAKVVANQPHDEEVALSDDDSEQASPHPGGGMGGTGDSGGGGRMQHGGGDSPPPQMSEDDRESEDDLESPPGSHHQSMGGGGGGPPPGQKMVHLEKREESEGGEKVEVSNVGAYNPADFAHLSVSEEVAELFQYIGRYKPQTHALDTKLKPFIPDYIPAVGDIDEFIKVARPDGKADDLGLKVLDEPAAKQSDPTVLNLQLRAVSKQANLKPMQVTSIENSEKDPRKITNWIQSIQDLHKNKPRPQVSYTKNMPDIETLMQEWPPEVEEALQHLMLPDENVDLPMADFIKVLCNILDIPVYNNPIESLHVMLTLYLEFKNNPFLAKGGHGGAAGANPYGPPVGFSSGANVLSME